MGHPNRDELWLTEKRSDGSTRPGRRGGVRRGPGAGVHQSRARLPRRALRWSARRAARGVRPRAPEGRQVRHAAARDPLHSRAVWATRPERRIVRIFTEGEVRTLDYIRGFVREFVNSDTADVRVEDRHGTPRTLVNWARESIRDEMSTTCGACSTWNRLSLIHSCTSHVSRGRRLRPPRHLQPVLSTGCCCTFRATPKPRPPMTWSRASRHADGRAKKRIDFAKYTAGVEAACRRAQHQSAATTARDRLRRQPSTSMPALIEFLRAL